MNFNYIKFKIDQDLAFVELARPEKMNAYNLEMFLELRCIQRELRKNKTIRAAIVSAQGDHFSSGLDVKSVMTNPKAALSLLWKWLPWQANLAQSMSYGWRRLPIPVIFVVQGRCWGAGLQTVLGGDFRFCHNNVSLAIMESKWGLIPDMGGAIALRELVGFDKAMDWTMTSREISATEALSSGLVSHVSDQPMNAAMNFVKSLLDKSPDAIAATKRLYQYSYGRSSKMILAKEWLLQWRMLLGKNRKIAVNNAKNSNNKLSFTERTIR